MQFDKGAGTVFLAVIIVALACLVGLYLLGGIFDSKASSDMAAATLQGQYNERARIAADHTETMFMLWTAWLHSSEGQNLLEALGALSLVVAGLLIGYQVGKIKDWFDRYGPK